MDGNPPRVERNCACVPLALTIPSWKFLLFLFLFFLFFFVLKMWICEVCSLKVMLHLGLLANFILSIEAKFECDFEKIEGGKWKQIILFLLFILV